MSVFLAVDEVANLLNVSRQAIQKNLRAGKYITRQVAAKGGRNGLKYEIALTSLSEDAQHRYHEQDFNQQVEKINEQASINTSTKSGAEPHVVLSESNPLSTKRGAGQRGILSKSNFSSDKALVRHGDSESSFYYTADQRKIGRAVEVVVLYIESFNGSKATAIKHIVCEYKTKNLPSHLLHALEHCKQKDKPNAAVVSRKTYYNWKTRHKKNGHYMPAIRQKDMEIKDWYYPAIKLYGRPQTPTFKFVEQELAKLFDPPITYPQITHFFNDIYSKLDLIKMRSKGMQQKQQLYFKKRTSKGMLPWDEVHADGWNTHFNAPHPVTGEYVTFEVWDLHDVATRYVPPFGIGLTENYEVIAKAFENAIRDYGVMAHLMTDSTKIVKKNKKFTGNPVLSIADRAGITIVHPQTVGNAQANGISENFHTYLDRESRELSTYQHPKKMDQLTFKRVKKLTAKLVKAKKAEDKKEADKLRREINKNASGILFESMEQMCDWLEEKRHKWNNHHHSGLEKIIDEVTGKKRHLSPNEAMEKFKQAGWQPVAMEESHLVDLFRPRVQRKIRRGVVAPYHKDVRFRNHELDHWEGKEVIISYDIMDYSQVWVMDLKGSLICVAKHDEAVSYRSEHASDLAQEKRALATVKRQENKINATLERAGLNELPVIEGEAKRVVDFTTIEQETKHEATVISIWGQIAEEEQPVIEKKMINFED